MSCDAAHFSAFNGSKRVLASQARDALELERRGYKVLFSPTVVLEKDGHRRSPKTVAEWVELERRGWTLREGMSSYRQRVRWGVDDIPFERLLSAGERVSRKEQEVLQTLEKVVFDSNRFSPSKVRKLVRQRVKAAVPETSVEIKRHRTIQVPYSLGRLRGFAATLADPGLTTLYHGTGSKNLESILRGGFRPPPYGGMLGQGIYFGRMDKAEGYGDLVLTCTVALGRCKELQGVEMIHDPANAVFDSLHLAAGKHIGVFGSGTLRREEWVIRRPEQVEILAVNLNEKYRSL